MNQDGLTVLAVDDDLINLKLISSMFRKNSSVSKVIEAKNGADAITMLRQNEVDLILLDIIMPIMDGIEMLKFLRADNELKGLPVIVLTTDETKKGEALEAGANGFLMKPIRERDVSAKIEEFFS